MDKFPTMHSTLMDDRNKVDHQNEEDTILYNTPVKDVVEKLNKTHFSASIVSERRVGKFHIDEEVLHSFDTGDIIYLMGYFFIVEAAYNVINRQFCYTAYSALFDVTDRGEEPPYYKVTYFKEKGAVYADRS